MHKQVKKSHKKKYNEKCKKKYNEKAKHNVIYDKIITTNILYYVTLKI